VRLVVPAALALGALLAEARALANHDPPVEQRHEQWVDFRARRVEVDGKLQRLELSGDVRVRSGRYQLTSERLRLEQSPRGAEVEGPGRIAFCPCAHPPVAFGFRSATVAPPTDLLIAGPSLELFGLPVFWAPYLWLRSPDRAGFLPATVALRGHDGWLLGSGVHLPWGERDTLGHRSALDLRAAGYLKGGAEVTAEVTTERTTTAVRWDHLASDLVGVEAHGSVTSDRLGAAAAWSVDALRGPRALVGTPSLEVASRRLDRARVSVVRAGENTILSLGLRADETRGTSLGELGAAGPRVGVAHLQPIGDAGTLEWEADATSLAHPSRGAVTVAESAGRARLDARPGVTVISAELGERVGVAVTELDETGDIESFGRLGLAWPLVRAFGRAPDPWLHWVEPYAESSIVLARRQGPWVELPDGNSVSVLAGLRSALGRLGARGALATSIRAGWVGPPEAPDRVVGGTLGITTEYVAVGTRAHWLWLEPQAFESSARARLGRLDSLHLGAYIEGRTRVEPLVARLVGPDPWRRLGAGWLDRSGWTAGAEALVPWTHWLSSSVGLDRDLIRPRWLGWRSGVAYRHPCGCLALVAGASERIGRRGIDGWLSVQLVP
jgi:hypothetical protein